MYDGHFFFILMVEVHEWFLHHLDGGSCLLTQRRSVVMFKGEAALFLMTNDKLRLEVARVAVRLEASWENSIIQVERHAPKNLFIILKKFKNSKELEYNSS